LTALPSASALVLPLRNKQMVMSLESNPGLKLKTPSVQTLGVLLFGLYCLWLSALGWADCVPVVLDGGAGEIAKVDRVYDGDTIKLVDGRHIRILGVNAPEVDHGKEKTGQSLGEEARIATEAFFKQNKTVKLYYDVQRVDRYERTLAHVYDAKGNSLSAYLLRNGLGFHVAIPPNLGLNECLHAEENIARNKRLGIWSDPYWQAKPAAELTLEDTGFKRIKGRVVNVRMAQSIWLELDGPLVIKITPSDKENFPGEQWQAWKGKQVEVRGWVTERDDDSDKSTSSSMKKTSKNKVKKSFKSLIVQPRIAENLELLK
jgi:micrococcal nuclease